MYARKCIPRYLGPSKRKKGSNKHVKNLSGLLQDHCLFSNREGLGTSLYTMGLATIDPQKELTEIHKIPKFGVNQASFD